MRPAHWIAAITALALGGSSAAFATTHTLDFVITNDTSDEWSQVIFEIRPPIGVSFNPMDYALVQFVVDPSRHGTTKNPVDIYVDAQDVKTLHFDYSDFTPITSNDGAVIFRVMIENPSGMDFRIGHRKLLLPSPSGVALVGLVGLVGLRRRRAS